MHIFDPMRKLKKDNQTNIGAAYAPGHLTGIFEIHHDLKNPLRSGSRGIGICINRGVETYVAVRRSDKERITVKFNEQLIAGNTTKIAIGNILEDHNYSIEINSFSELPLSQGFGLSAAGALSSVLAVNAAMDFRKDYKELVNAAHIAEVTYGTGLGDVVAQSQGGLVVREAAGGFGCGKFRKFVGENIDYDAKIVTAIFCKELKTEKIIKNQKYISKINSAAGKRISEFQKRPSLPEFFKLSYKFSRDTNLMDNNVSQIISKIHNNNLGYASMAMLGNTIFATGQVDKIVDLCRKTSKVFICKIDQNPARNITIANNKEDI